MRRSRTITAPSCSGEATEKIESSSSSLISACIIVPLSQYSLRPRLLLQDQQRAAPSQAEQKTGVREQRDGAILGPPSPRPFTVAALHSEEAAAADLFERPSQLGLKDDRNRDRGTDDHQAAGSSPRAAVGRDSPSQASRR